MVHFMFNHAHRVNHLFPRRISNSKLSIQLAEQADKFGLILLSGHLL